MGQRSSFLVAALFGVALSITLVQAIGYLAALPVPGVIFGNLKSHKTLLFVFESVVLIDLPVLMLSFVAGRILFRLLRRSTPALILVCAAPWVLGLGYDMLRSFLNWPNETRLGLTFSLVSWSTLFTVPAGLFLASLIRLPRSLSGNPHDREPHAR